MCKVLNINFSILAKINYKGVLVEKFHRFIKKSITMAAKDRGTNDVFVSACVVVGYTWNSSLIDRTDILRIISTIGRKLTPPPLVIDINALPQLVYNITESFISYLCLTDSNQSFASEILKILVNDHRTTLTERINTTRNIITMYPRDLIMARTAIQSDKAKDIVA